MQEGTEYVAEGSELETTDGPEATDGPETTEDHQTTDGDVVWQIRKRPTAQDVEATKMLLDLRKSEKYKKNICR